MMTRRARRRPVGPPSVRMGGLAAVAGLLALLFPGGEAAAQVTASERATLSQVISGTEVELDYSRPSARGREPLFGGVVPWGEVWTPGANVNTTLRLSKDATLDGHEVPAGLYGVWIQVAEDGAWTFVLHGDTALFHTDHPPVESGFLSFPVEREGGDDFVETLTLDLQHIRADGAVLQLAWGHDRVRVDLGVDPGFVTTVAPEVAERFVGDWEVDQSMGVPPDSVVADIRASLSPEELPMFEGWLASMMEPRTLHIRYEDEYLVVEDPGMEAFYAQGTASVTLILMERADGIFEQGVLFQGELAFAGDVGLWEFEFDGSGRAVSFVGRGPMDEVAARGTRLLPGG